MINNYPPGVRERDILPEPKPERGWFFDPDFESSLPDGSDAGQLPQPLPLAHQPADANCGGNGLCRKQAGDNVLAESPLTSPSEVGGRGKSVSCAAILPVNQQPRAGVNNQGRSGDS